MSLKFSMFKFTVPLQFTIWNNLFIEGITSFDYIIVSIISKHIYQSQKDLNLANRWVQYTFDTFFYIL